MKIKREIVGTGVTKSQRTTWIAKTADEARQAWDAQEAFAREDGGYVDPKSDFPSWLDHFERQLAQTATIAKIPTRRDSIIAFDLENRNNWRYVDKAEAELLLCAAHQPRPGHEFKSPGAAHVTNYLMNEDATGWQWGYQSFRWYIGREMQLLNWCRRALRDQAWLKLAGLCIELGSINRERKLKWPADRAVALAEKEKAAAELLASEAKLAEADALRREAKSRRREEEIEAWRDKGHETVKARAVAWKECARRLAEGNPATDWSNVSEVAREVLKKWPEGVWRPKQFDTLRKHLGELALANRHDLTSR